MRKHPLPLWFGFPLSASSPTEADGTGPALKVVNFSNIEWPSGGQRLRYRTQALVNRNLM